MTRGGDAYGLLRMKNSFGFGSAVGSGHQNATVTNAPNATMGTAIIRRTNILRRAKATELAVLAGEHEAQHENQAARRTD